MSSVDVPNNVIGPITYDALADLLDGISAGGGGAVEGGATEEWCNDKFVPIYSQNEKNLISNANAMIQIGDEEYRVLFKAGAPPTLYHYNEDGTVYSASPLATLDDGLTDQQKEVFEKVVVLNDTVGIDADLKVEGSIMLDGQSISKWSEISNAGGLTDGQTAVLNQMAVDPNVGLFINNNLTGSREMLFEPDNWINANYATNDIQVSLDFTTENGYITIQGMPDIQNFPISTIILHEPFTLPVGLVNQLGFTKLKFSVEQEGQQLVFLFSDGSIFGIEEEDWMNLFDSQFVPAVKITRKLVNIDGSFYVNGYPVSGDSQPQPLPNDLTLKHLGFQTAQNNITPFDFTPIHFPVGGDLDEDRLVLTHGNTELARFRCTPEGDDDPGMNFIHFDANVSVDGAFSADAGNGSIAFDGWSEIVNQQQVSHSSLNLTADNINLLGTVLVNNAPIGSGGGAGLTDGQAAVLSQMSYDITNDKLTVGAPADFTDSIILDSSHTVKITKWTDIATTGLTDGQTAVLDQLSYDYIIP
jgi:hypothetical protein